MAYQRISDLKPSAIFGGVDVRLGVSFNAFRSFEFLRDQEQQERIRNFKREWTEMMRGVIGYRTDLTGEITHIGFNHWNMEGNKKFKIGAKVFPLDASYNKNLATGYGEKIVVREGERPVWTVKSTPFKCIVETDREKEMVLLERADGVTFMVFNNLEDATMQKVKLNDEFTAEVYRSDSLYEDGFIKVGCQKIPFARVRELYEVIFQGKIPNNENIPAPTPQIHFTDRVIKSWKPYNHEVGRY